MAWAALFGSLLGAQAVFNCAWMYGWWRPAQWVLAGVSLVAAVWVVAEHRPRCRVVPIVGAVLAVGQWHLLRLAWTMVVWSFHYRP